MSSKSKISILTTGLANVASVLAAFSRLGFEAEFVESAKETEAAKYLVIPGVGAFGAGMAKLEELSLSDAIRKRVEKDYPTLGICLGMQLLCRSSEESPGVVGLGIIDGVVTRLSAKEKVPQLGWNKVEPQSEEGLVKNGYAYFANSYCLSEAPNSCVPSFTLHGENFVSAIQLNNLLACQFHPELSGSWGNDLLRNWSAL